MILKLNRTSDILEPRVELKLLAIWNIYIVGIIFSRLQEKKVALPNFRRETHLEFVPLSVNVVLTKSFDEAERVFFDL